MLDASNPASRIALVLCRGDVHTSNSLAVHHSNQTPGVARPTHVHRLQA